MSTDLRMVLEEGAAGPVEPLDLEGAVRQARFRKIRRRLTGTFSAIGIAVAALFFVGPSLFRQVGLQQVETADDPPTSERDEGIGNTGDLTEKGGFAPGSLGTGGQPGSQAGTRQGVAVARGSAPTPTPPGTYSFDVSGRLCGEFQGSTSSCEALKELELTFDPPTGSHQRESGRFTYDGEAKQDFERGDDYRPDGVHWEHYSATFVNASGVPTAWACPQLEAEPHLWWLTGAKPGDHWDRGSECNDYSPTQYEWRFFIVSDILRAETVSVGGREVVTFFVREDVYREGKLEAFWEGRKVPDHPRLFVDGHWWWDDDWGRGELWATLKSLTPS